MNVQRLVQLKCPVCGKGDLFQYKAHHLSKFSIMHSSCLSCGFHFEREPGFYTGAMYFSYAISVAIIVTFVVGLNILMGRPPLWLYFVCIIGSLVLLTPLNFRYSRALMLYLFGGVDKKSK